MFILQEDRLYSLRVVFKINPLFDLIFSANGKLTDTQDAQLVQQMSRGKACKGVPENVILC